MGAWLRSGVRYCLRGGTAPILGSALSVAASAQCEGRWVDGHGPPSIQGVEALLAAPNGDVLAGGAGALARWDGVRWTPAGSPGDVPTANSLALLTDGTLAAGGYFDVAHGASGNAIARWNGAAWLPLGSGLVNGVPYSIAWSLLARPQGGLVAGGNFALAGGVPALNIAQWDGSQWLPFGPGLNGPVTALAAMPNGDPIAGGDFSHSGTTAVANIARWDGASWSQVGSGFDGQVQALVVLQDGSLVAGGQFRNAGATLVNGVSRWNGSAWTPLGVGVGGIVWVLCVLPDSSIVAGGNFQLAGGIEAKRVAIWRDGAWSALGGGVDSDVRALAYTPHGEVVVGGYFQNAGGFDSRWFARWSLRGVPWVATPPLPQTAGIRGSASFIAVPAPGYGDLSLAWQLNGRTLADGVTPNGTVVSGSTTGSIRLDNLSPLDSGQIRCRIDNPCGATTSPPARLTVGLSACPGDTTGDGLVNFLDLNIVLTTFGSTVVPGDYGDLNADGRVNFQDLNLVLTAFGSVC